MFSKLSMFWRSLRFWAKAGAALRLRAAATADAMIAFFMVLSSLIRSFQMRGGTLCLLGLPRLMGTIMLTGYDIVNL